MSDQIPGRGAGERLHHLDLLRAGAMLLGIVYHAVLAAPALGQAIPASARWEIDACTWLAGTLHAFRLPLFFLMAGFFAALVVRRGGAGPFLAGRLRRIGIPLAVGVVTIVPAVDVVKAIATGGGLEAFVLDPRPVHLWFLWYLLLFYAIVLSAQRVGGELCVRLGNAVRGALAGRGAHVVLVTTTAVFLFLIPVFETDPQYGFTPEPGVFVYYLAFFTIGWALYVRPDVLHGLGRGWPAQLTVALVASIALARLPHQHVGHALAAVVLAVLVWTAVGGLIGAARRFASNPSTRIRYLADASYWLYLVHLPLVLATHVLVAPLGLGIALTAAAAVAVTTAIALLTYEHLVRYTVIGRVLHGPRARPVRGALVVSGRPGIAGR